MKLLLSDNIRLWRHKLDLTQEDLAEAMGVSIGAVSKWESGQSNPELPMLVELADFFGISIDVLIGYEWKERKLGDSVEKIKEFCNKKQFEEGIVEARKTLKMFPNSFEIIYYSANLFFLCGLEKRKKEYLEEALKYFNKALNNVSQNNDENISDILIQNEIGNVYLALQEYDKAITILKKHNYNGLNNSKIGFTLYLQKKYNEALPVLSDSFLNSILELFRSTIGLANCLENLNKLYQAIDILQWLEKLILTIKVEKNSYLDRLLSFVYIGLAIFYTEIENDEEADKCIKKAIFYAKRFDEKPEYDISQIKYYYGKSHIAYDDIGDSNAIESIKEILNSSILELQKNNKPTEKLLKLSKLLKEFVCQKEIK